MEKNIDIDYVKDGSITHLYLRNNQEIIVSLHNKKTSFVSLYADNDILRITDLNKNEVNTPYKEREKLKAQKTYNKMVEQREKQKNKNK